MAERRIRILWTKTAKEALARLPRKARQRLTEKADKLYECADPREFGKPLLGSLSGCYRIRYSSYRAVYTVDEERLANGDVLITFTVRFVIAGPRKGGDKGDVYVLAKRLVRLGLVESPGDD